MVDLEIQRAADQIAVVLARRLANKPKIQVGVNSPLAEAAAIMAENLNERPPVAYYHALSGVHYRPPVTSIFASEMDAVALGGAYTVEAVLDRLQGWEGIDDEPLHPLQTDGRGRVNLTGISDGKGGYRLLGPGTAGLDILPAVATSRPVLYCTRHTVRTLVERVSMVTAWGAEDGQGEPADLVTDLCTFSLSPADGARLVSLHSWVDLDQIRQNTGFAFTVASAVPTTPAPTEAELRLLDRVDPSNLRVLEFYPSEERVARVLEVWAQEAQRSTT